MCFVLEGRAEKKQRKFRWWRKGRNTAKDEERPSSDAKVAIAIESNRRIRKAIVTVFDSQENDNVPNLLTGPVMTDDSLPTSPVPLTFSRTRRKPPSSTPDALIAGPFKGGFTIGSDQLVTSSPPQPLSPSASLIQTNESPPSRIEEPRIGLRWDASRRVWEVIMGGSNQMGITLEIPRLARCTKSFFKGI